MKTMNAKLAQLNISLFSFTVLCNLLREIGNRSCYKLTCAISIDFITTTFMNKIRKLVDI